MICGLVILLTASCGAVRSLPKNSPPLVLTLKMTHDADISFTSVRGQITLKNQSDSNLLVNSRLLVLPQQAPPNWQKCFC